MPEIGNIQILRLRKHPELVEFITAALNHFAVNAGEDGNWDWRDYYSESDIDEWLIDRMKLSEEPKHDNAS